MDTFSTGNTFPKPASLEEFLSAVKSIEQSNHDIWVSVFEDFGFNADTDTLIIGRAIQAIAPPIPAMGLQIYASGIIADDQIYFIKG